MYEISSDNNIIILYEFYPLKYFQYIKLHKENKLKWFQ